MSRPKMYKHRETVWEDKQRCLRVVFEEDKDLFLEFGNDISTCVYLKVNINGFWTNLVEYMNRKKLSPPPEPFKDE